MTRHCLARGLVVGLVLVVLLPSLALADRFAPDLHDEYGKPTPWWGVVLFIVALLIFLPWLIDQLKLDVNTSKGQWGGTIIAFILMFVVAKIIVDREKEAKRGVSISSYSSQMTNNRSSGRISSLSSIKPKEPTPPASPQSTSPQTQTPETLGDDTPPDPSLPSTPTLQTTRSPGRYRIKFTDGFESIADSYRIEGDIVWVAISFPKSDLLPFPSPGRGPYKIRLRNGGEMLIDNYRIEGDVFWAEVRLPRSDLLSVEPLSIH